MPLYGRDEASLGCLQCSKAMGRDLWHIKRRRSGLNRHSTVCPDRRAKRRDTMSRKRRAGAQRKRRSDHGTWKKSGRDQDGMLFVAQQKFVRLDTLAEFFAPGYERAVDPPKHQQ